MIVGAWLQTTISHKVVLFEKKNHKYTYIDNDMLQPLKIIYFNHLKTIVHGDLFAHKCFDILLVHIAK